jgi:multiple sugar transport system substrate-binding protein
MIKGEDKADYIPSVMEYMGSKGNIVMLPRFTDVQLMHYRADLFNNPDEQAKFKAKYGRDLKPPESWPEEFLQVAEFFTRPPEMHGFGVAAIHSTFAEWTLSSGGEFMDKNLKAVWNGPKGVEAMKFFRELFQKTFPGGASQWSHLETSEAARQGRLAMWMDWPGNWKQYFDPKVSKVGDSIDVVTKPYHKPSGRDKQVVYGGSWAWTFPAKAKNTEASFALIEFMAKPDNQLLEHKASGAVPVRKSIWTEAKNLAAQDKDPRTKKRADLLEWTINHFWAYPDREMPEGNGLRTKHLIPLLQKALLGEMEIEAALNESAKLVNEGAKELGYKIDG